MNCLVFTERAPSAKATDPHEPGCSTGSKALSPTYIHVPVLVNSKHRSCRLKQDKHPPTEKGIDLHGSQQPAGAHEDLCLSLVLFTRSSTRGDLRSNAERTPALFSYIHKLLHHTNVE